MIGLPTETMEDVAGIAHLGQQVVEAYYSNPKRAKGRSVKGNVQCFLFCAKTVYSISVGASGFD